MLLDDLASALNLDGATARTYSITNLNGKGLHIEGVVTIQNFSTVKINLVLGKIPFAIFGENLKVENFCLGSLTVTGEIYGYYNRSKVKFDN